MHKLVLYCSKQFLEPKDHPRFQYEYPTEKNGLNLILVVGVLIAKFQKTITINHHIFVGFNRQPTK
jgi:hypothetical protein